MVAVLALLLVLPVALLVRQRLADPLAGQLDALGVPAAVDLHHADDHGQSPYCVDTCAWLKRIYQSGQPAQQTDTVFRSALTAHGWRTAKGTCPKPADGSYSCWQRDQYVLDLWVRPANCDSSAYHPLPVPSESVPPAEGDVEPSAEPSPTGPASAQCPTAQASVQLANAADPVWRSQH